MSGDALCTGEMGVMVALPMRMEVRLVTGLVIGLTGWMALWAQEAPLPEASTATVTVEQVQAAAQATAARSDLAAETKAAAKESYDAAIAALGRGVAAREKRDKFAAALTVAPEAAKKSAAQLETLVIPQDPEDLVTAVERQLAPDELKALLMAEEGALVKTQADFKASEDALVAEGTRLGEIPTDIESVQKRQQQAEAALEPLRGIDAVAEPGKAAERTRWQAELAAAQAELEMFEQEKLSAGARGQQKKARRDVLERQALIAKARVEGLRKLVTTRVNQVASEVARVAADAARAGGPPALVKEVQAYAEELESVSEKITSAQDAMESLTRRFDKLENDYGVVQRQVEAMGESGVAAQLLLEQQRVLPDPRKERRAIRQAGGGIAEIRLDRIRIDNELRRALPATETADPQVEILREAKQRVLGELDDQYERLILAQGDLELKQRAFLANLESFHDLLSEKLFWVRSSPMIGPATVAELPLATAWLAGPARWQELARAGGAMLKRAPLPLGFLAVVLVALIGLRGRFRARMAAMLGEIRRIKTDRYVLTLEVLALTILQALPFPLLLWGCGRLLMGDPVAADWLLGLGQGLQRAAPLLFGFVFIRALCQKDGLGEGHFRWKPALTARLRAGVRRIAWLYVPAAAVLVMLFSESSGRHVHSLGRLLFMAAMIWLAWGVGYILRPRDGVFAAYLKKHPEGLFSRLRYGWYGLAILAPVILVILAAWGYLVTALKLSAYLQATAGIVAGAVIGYALLLRWFTIRERKLTLERTLAERKARREAAQQTAANQFSGEEGSLPEAEREAVDLAQVGAQTRSLLRAVTVTGAAVCLWFAWADALPALRGLDVEPVLGAATAADLLVAMLFAVVTVVVAKNLPGILEIAVLRNLPFDSGSRYAAATLARYVIVAVGLVAVFQVLPLDWAQFGWILTALSVGLGFGLQEIVANFVCGIILLFERPIRVGDIVTISGTTGTVTRIRMRATTITDWDRKELVVPNKEFITGQVLNWTLSNTTNRIVINVGIAYGSDTERARDLILDILRLHPDVADDPAPVVGLENFGDSSLDFVVRCYLPNLDRRVGVIHELHTEIHRRFKEAGIEIPFPQRDLHVRSGRGGGAGGEALA